MPIYEYLCHKCDYKFEQIQKINDAPIEVCPTCNEKSVQKMVSAPQFKLKGTGWYETDFKNKLPKKAEGSSKSDKSSKQSDSKTSSGAKEGS